MSQACNSLISSPTQERPHYHVLIVDDDDVIREGLLGYLENYHEAAYDLTLAASANAMAAKEQLKHHHYDLVISDINMPEEDGFGLIQYIHQHHPKTKTAMITAYQVEDYIRNAKKTGVFNIITKTAPFNFEELSTVVNNLLHPSSAFGLAQYMAPECQLTEVVIQNSDDIMTAFNTLQSFLERRRIHEPNDLLTAVIEAITNAVYHVAKLPDGSLKYEKGQPIAQLEPHEYVFVYFGQDFDQLGISIVDQGGRITADEILYWLDRNVSGTGLMDTHGRGVYLMHRLMDRIIINIAPGQRTEIILLDYLSPTRTSHNKPLYINQIEQ